LRLACRLPLVLEAEMKSQLNDGLGL